MSEVIARAVRPSRWIWTNLLVQALLASLWTRRFLDDGEVLAGVVAGAFVLLLLLGCTLVATTPRATVVLTDEVLLVQRRWRPRRVARSSVRAVHGDILGRPTWSETVVVETDTGAFRLGGFDIGTAALIERLQNWAQVGEQASAT
ncbi:MAG TPA: hypothetical protein VGC57_07915 [Cellulomonas sp.]